MVVERDGLFLPKSRQTQVAATGVERGVMAASALYLNSRCGSKPRWWK